MTDLDYTGFWNTTLTQLRNDLGEEEFSGWFTDLRYLRAGENLIVIGVPSTFHRDKVKARYQNAIKTRLKELAGKDIALEFELAGDKAENSPSVPETAAGGSGHTGQKKGNLPSKAPEKLPQIEKPEKGRHPNLRDDYTFDNYIMGENNKFAVMVAKGISDKPGINYNPCLIYGGVGLGKTHLMQAIGNKIHETGDYKIIYTTAENFLNEFVQSIKENKPNSFKNKFRYTDVLLIDDIHFFQEKEGIQEELFHTYNTLLSSKKQLVFTCDRPITELKKFSERLLSRFVEGISVDLRPPQYEERCAILKLTAEKRGANISDEVIDVISKNISSNVRDLKSALNILIAYSELMGQSVTVEIAQQRLRDTFISPRQANLSIETIQRVAADYFGLTIKDMTGKKRSQNIVFPRQLAMYVAREMTEFSTTEIGQVFGGRDHTTVMHSIEKIKGQLLTDSTLDSTIESLKRLVKEFSSKS
ncbi:MAG: chromosomal replication initiator protein DnaA [Treponema sp.]|jgi:chromosomal replication initiator protein|nr:chromosomal replication initiator protein DnaA [Treponema sp.]